MGDVRARRRPGRLELERLDPEPLEEPGPSSEEDRCDMKTQLVQLPGLQRLLDHAGAAADRNVLAAGRRPSLLERGLETAGHEVERRTAVLVQRLARVMREDEDGHMKGRVVPPPSVRVRVVLPGALPAAEHLPAHDDGAGSRDRRRKELVVLVADTAVHAVPLTEAGEPEDPLVQLLSTFAERLLQRRIRPGDEAVERDRYVREYFAHAM